jgi:hypothetical protein
MVSTINIIDIAGRLPRKPEHPYWKLRRLNEITRIVVHYDAVRVPPAKQQKLAYDPLTRYIEQARFHIGKNWNDGRGTPVFGFGLMYHYRVSADGRVWRAQPEELVTWHARDANQNGLAICCDLGPGQKPTIEQMAGLESLLNWLCYHRPDIPAGRADVWGHGELRKAGNQTPCPGALLSWVQAYRRG